MNRKLRTLFGTLTCLAFASVTHAAWPEVPPMKWQGISVDDFADHELDVPYLLQHLHTVANSVVEEGPTRGFLAIKVNREPKDNEPYNARIQENNLALAYFYATKRPWNPYYGSEAVKVRLEAMLEYWCSIQHPQTGLFSEYSPTNFSLAPTGFGVAHISRTLELLTAGGPTIDSTVLDRTIAAQRKAILALLTRDEVFEWTHSWSNQHTGVIRAGLSLLKMKPDDAELRSALMSGVKRAAEVSQSPAGFLYEAAGPDIGYSSVHERFMAFADAMVQEQPPLKAILSPHDALWGKWLEHNLVPQPGEPLVFVANGAVHTRTSHSVQAPRRWPQAQHQPNWVAFQMTDEERDGQVARQRKQLRDGWPTFKPLVVPSTYAYLPTPLFLASTDSKIWAPTREQRERAVNALPYNAADRFTHQAYDARRKWSFTYVRRPNYYATFATGTPQARQTFGLGLLWNQTMGTVLQGVAGTEWTCGSVVGDANAVAESKAVDAKVVIQGNPVSPTDGWKTLTPGDVAIRYALPDWGTKVVTFTSDAIRVETTRAGELVEQFPLLVHDEDQITVEGQAVRIQRAENSFVMTFDGNARAALGEKKPVGSTLPGYSRLLCSVSARDRLNITLRFETK